MKRLIALVLLVSVIGTVYGVAMPQAQQSRPVMNQPLSSVYRSWLGPFLQSWIRSVAPGPGQALRMPPVKVQVPLPVPPVCNSPSCLLRPVQGIAQ